MDYFEQLHSEYIILKEAFFTPGEMTRWEEIKKDSDQWDVHQTLIRYPFEELLTRAYDVIDSVNAGKYDDKQMEYAENSILHYLAAMNEISKQKQSRLVFDFGDESTM